MLQVIGAFAADATPVRLSPQTAIAAPSAAAAVRILFLDNLVLPWGISEGTHAVSAHAPSADRTPRARATHPSAPLARHPRADCSAPGTASPRGPRPLRPRDWRAALPLPDQRGRGDELNQRASAGQGG